MRYEKSVFDPSSLHAAVRHGGAPGFGGGSRLGLFGRVPGRGADRRDDQRLQLGGEYIANGTEGSLDINAEFTRRTGIEVNYTTFDSNESLYSKLAGGGANYDVIIPPTT